MVSRIINEKCKHSAEHNKLDYQSIKINIVVIRKNEIPLRTRRYGKYVGALIFRNTVMFCSCDHFKFE